MALVDQERAKVLGALRAERHVHEMRLGRVFEIEEELNGKLSWGDAVKAGAINGLVTAGVFVVSQGDAGATLGAAAALNGFRLANRGVVALIRRDVPETIAGLTSNLETIHARIAMHETRMQAEAGGKLDQVQSELLAQLEQLRMQAADHEARVLNQEQKQENLRKHEEAFDRAIREAASHGAGVNAYLRYVSPVFGGFEEWKAAMRAAGNDELSTVAHMLERYSQMFVETSDERKRGEVEEVVESLRRQKEAIMAVRRVAGANTDQTE